MAIGGFLFGGNTGLTYDQLQRRREMVDALTKQVMGEEPKNAMAGIGAVLKGAGAGIGRYMNSKAMDDQRAAALPGFNSLVNELYGGITGGAPLPAGASAGMPMPGAAGEMAATRPAADVSKNGSTFSPFISTVQAGGLTNPYGLAAVAATGRAESGWSSDKAAGSWADPSESGQAGTSGGVMSWRAERLANLRRYAASKGEQGNGSPQTQGEFFMQEDPQLIARLNAAKSTEEAQSIINDAWKFAGYNRPGGEAGRRLGYANGYVSQFQGGGNEVASLDPSVGMPSAAAAIEKQAPASGQPISGYRDPVVSAPNYRGPENPATVQPQEIASTSPFLPPRTVGPGPRIASPPAINPAAPVPAMSAPGLDQKILRFMASPQFAFLDRTQQAMLANALEVQQRRQQALYEQMLKQNDPAYQADLRLKNAQTEDIVNPKIKPGEQARLTFDEKKLGIDQENRKTLTAAEQAAADNNRDRLGFDREKFTVEQANRNTMTAAEQANAENNRNRLTLDTRRQDYDENKPMIVEPGQSVFLPKSREMALQGTGFKPADVDKLRNDFTNLPSYKNYTQALPSYQSMIDTAKTDSKASDLNLVYGLGKIMDPGSVVREGEMIMVNNTSSVPDWLLGAINSVNGGSRLEPATRKAILAEARSRLQAYRGAVDNDISQYRGIIGRRGMNEADIIPNLGAVADVPDLTGVVPTNVPGVTIRKRSN